MGLVFEWDPKKESLNVAQHGVTFVEARSVFDDPNAGSFDDPEHSNDEVREIMIGYSANGRLLFVSFTNRRSSVIRIISARIAVKRERNVYEHKIKNQKTW